MPILKSKFLKLQNVSNLVAMVVILIFDILFRFCFAVIYAPSLMSSYLAKEIMISSQS